MKKVMCLMVVMLLAVNASATVWVGGDTAVAPAGGDGTSWGDVGNWVEGEESSWYLNSADGTGALAWNPPPTTLTPASALPSSSNGAFILGERLHGSAWWNPFGPAEIDPAFHAGPATLSGSATVGNTWVGYKGYGGTLNVSSTGTLNTTQLVVGFLGNGAFLNNQGTIASSGDMWVGWASTSDTAADNYGNMSIGGSLNLGSAGYTSFSNHSGTLDIAGSINMDQSSGFAHVQIDGGTITAGNLIFDAYYQDTVDITEGVLILDGDFVTGSWVDPENAAIGWGLDFWTTPIVHDEGNPGEWTYLMISAYGGTGTVMYDYDITNPGQTTVWAVVPEPATMTLLGLGAVALLRRRK